MTKRKMTYEQSLALGKTNAARRANQRKAARLREEADAASTSLPLPLPEKTREERDAEEFEANLRWLERQRRVEES